METTQKNYKAWIWTGRILKSLLSLFLLFDAVMKIIQHREYVKGTQQLGLAKACVLPLGLYLFAATILYIFPRTSFAGAVLLTAYLGGAAAITYAASNGSQPYLFPVIFTSILWLAEYMTSKHLRSLVQSSIFNI